MRLWTIHPEYLDAKGLTATWREGLLAQKVLSGKTRGYTRHPQLIRFREQKNPLRAIASYLREILLEAKARGYQFSEKKIPRRPPLSGKIPTAQGQLKYEWRLFLEKIRSRDPGRFKRLRDITRPRPHPVFSIRAGGIASWEKPKPGLIPPPACTSSQRRATGK
jgi:hypothetical protein